MVTLFGIDEDGLSTERIIGMGAVTVAISVYFESVWWFASDEVKDELKYDESKINKSLLISKMSEMSALWRLFKRQISDYKNLK